MAPLPSLHPSRSEFVPLRLSNGLYVDKTAHLHSLLPPAQPAPGARIAEQSHYHCLTRPRRFGKTLLVSTLEAWFQGHMPLVQPCPEPGSNPVADWQWQHYTTRELFAGTQLLAVRPAPNLRPVIRLNMADVQGDTVLELQESLLSLLSRVYTLWHQRGVNMASPHPANDHAEIHIPPERGIQAPAYLRILIHRLHTTYQVHPVVLWTNMTHPLPGWQDDQAGKPNLSWQCCGNFTAS